MASLAERTPGTRVVLVRHGESVVSVDRVVGGLNTCSGLSPLGRQQAERLRDRLAHTGELDIEGERALYASGYPRAIQTAETIAPALGGLEVLIEHGFGEQDPGPECDGLTYTEFVERHGRPDWETNPYGVTYPGGETVAAFDLRVGTAMSDVLDRHDGGMIIVACHAGVIDRILRQFLRAPTAGVFELNTRNTSLTEFVLASSGKWRMARYNDAAHLAGLALATPPVEVADVVDAGRPPA